MYTAVLTLLLANMNQNIMTYPCMMMFFVSICLFYALRRLAPVSSFRILVSNSKQKMRRMRI
jgi:hypothetical protein